MLWIVALMAPVLKSIEGIESSPTDEFGNADENTSGDDIGNTGELSRELSGEFTGDARFSNAHSISRGAVIANARSGG
jgi:hypothetical protein